MVNDEKNSRGYTLGTGSWRLRKGRGFSGKLGEYKYYDVNVVIDSALVMYEKEQ